jgi:hypothetical protein
LAIEASGVQDELDLAAAWARTSTATSGARHSADLEGDDVELVQTPEHPLAVRFRSDGSIVAPELLCSAAARGAPAPPSPGAVPSEPEAPAPGGPDPRDPSLVRRAREVERERQERWHLDGAVGGGLLTVAREALDGGDVTEIGTVCVADFTGNLRGLVPDGRQLYLADPGYYAFDRTTLAPTVRAPWLGELEIVAFSPGGGYLVLVTEDPHPQRVDAVVLESGVVQIVDRAALGLPPRRERWLLRVLDTATGRTWIARWLPGCELRAEAPGAGAPPAAATAGRRLRTAGRGPRR